MAARMRRVWFSGLDPVPIRVMIAEDAAETAVFSAACLPVFSYAPSDRIVCVNRLPSLTSWSLGQKDLEQCCWKPCSGWQE